MQIRKKLFLIIAISILVTAVPGGALMVAYTQHQVLTTASTELEASTGWLAGALSQRLTQHPDQPLSGSFKALSALSGRYPGTQHFLIDPHGNFLLAGAWQATLDSHGSTWRPDLSDEPQLAELLGGPLGDTPRTLDTELSVSGRNYLAIGAQLTTGGRYFNLTPMDEITAPSRHLFLVRAGIALVLLGLGGGAIALAVGNRITRRLDALRDVMQGHALDNTLRFPPNLMGNDEIGEVGRVYNTLADDVDRNIAGRLQAQASLADAEELWRFALEGAGYGVWDWNVATDTLRFSPRSQDMLQLPAEIQGDVRGAWGKRVHPDDQALANQKMREHLHGESASYTGEYRVSDPSGHYRWILTRGRVVSRDASGYPLRVIGTHIDISARKGVETALANSRLMLKTVLNAMPDLIWLKDVDGRYLACNSRFEAFFGAAEHDILGKTDYDFIDAGLADFFRSNDKKAMRTGGLHMNEEWITFAADGHKELLETTKLAVTAADGELIGVLGIGHDVTHNRQLADALQQREQYLRALLDTLPFNTWLKDEHSNFLAVNERFAAGFGWPSAHSLIGKSDLDIATPALAAQYRADDASVLATGRAREFEESVEVNGVMQWHETYKTPVSIDGRVIGTVGFSRDITVAKEQRQQLEHSAHYDALTNLPNRVLLADRLRQALMHCQRRGLRVAVAYLDLDGFKSVNDQYGHDVGDQLLIAVASRTKQALREGDTLARMGGDEFVAVLTDLEDTQACVPLLKRLLDAAATPVVVNGVQLQVSASMGVALFPQRDPVDGDHLLRQADQAMYQAKSSGKNCYQFFADEKPLQADFGAVNFN
jgi:diguanylate cyclase (GGDEF)-like protein/PAS domain S-box-containing protein